MQKIIAQVEDTEPVTGQYTIGYILSIIKDGKPIVQQAGRRVQVTNELDVLLNRLTGE